MIDSTFLASLLHPMMLIKIGFLVILALYSVFAFVIYNQVRVMNKIFINPSIEIIIEIFAILHLLGAISLFAAIVAIL